MLEVRQLSAAVQRMKSLGLRQLEITGQEADEVGKRAAFKDVDGNVFEFWERPGIAPLQAAMLQAEQVARLETWQFHATA